jgi:hypothetical protein
MSYTKSVSKNKIDGGASRIDTVKYDNTNDSKKYSAEHTYEIINIIKKSLLDYRDDYKKRPIRLCIRAGLDVFQYLSLSPNFTSKNIVNADSLYFLEVIDFTAPVYADWLADSLQIKIEMYHL